MKAIEAKIVVLGAQGNWFSLLATIGIMNIIGM